MGGIFLDTGKNIWIQKSSRVIKGLIVSYLVSGAGLLLLALLLLKYQLDERKVSAGILAVYILSGLSGGIYMGKTAEREASYSFTEPYYYRDEHDCKHHPVIQRFKSIRPAAQICKKYDGAIGIEKRAH